MFKVILNGETQVASLARTSSSKTADNGKKRTINRTTTEFLVVLNIKCSRNITSLLDEEKQNLLDAIGWKNQEAEVVAAFFFFFK